MLKGAVGAVEDKLGLRIPLLLIVSSISHTLVGPETNELISDAGRDCLVVADCHATHYVSLAASPPINTHVD